MMTDALEFAVRLAQTTGDMLLDRFRSGAWQADLKSDRTVVTSADLEADRAVATAITAAFPDDALLSEEVETFAEPDLRRALWIVDPLDGTTNFSLGLPIWGVLICRVVAGEPQVGAACFPALGETYSAQRGAGAWLNGEPLRVPPADAARRPQTVFACCSNTHRLYDVRVPYKTRILGSAAYTLCAVARGIARLGLETTAHIWDIAAPWLVLQEAGGVAFALHSPQPFPLTPADGVRSRIYTVLAAEDARSAERGRAWLRPQPVGDADLQP